MFVALDRVLESTASTGTGAVTLAGAVDGFIPFSSIGIGNFTWYCIESVDDNGVPSGQWEVGTGLVGPGTLSRDVVHASSNGGLLVNFTAGVKRVFGNVPAHQLSKLVNQSGINSGDDLVQMSITRDSAGLRFVFDEEAPSPGKYYGTNSAGAKGFHNLPTSTLEAEWKFDMNTDTDQPPGNGKFRTNAVLFSTSDRMSISVISNTGIDRTNVLKTVRVDDVISIQDKGDAANWVRYRITSAIPIEDHGTWFKFPVSFVEGGGTIPSNNSPSLFIFTAVGGSPGYTDPQAQDAAAQIFLNATHTGISFSYNTTTNTMSAFVSGGGGGGGDAFQGLPLSQFAPTTSAQLAGVITDETGTGALVFGTGPTITNPVGITKANVGLGNVDNTSDANKPVSTAQQTAINAAISTHEGAANPHPVYLTQAEGDAIYAPAGHTHAYQPLDADLTNIASLAVAGNALKVIRVNAAANAYELATVSGGGGGDPPVSENSTTDADLSPVWAQTIGSAVPMKITFNTYMFNPAQGRLTIKDLKVGLAQGNPGSEGRIKLMADSGGGSTDIRPSTSLSANWTLRLPSGSGLSNQVMATDGTGASRWAEANALVPILNYIYGFHIEYIDATTIRIFYGQARDNDNVAIIEQNDPTVTTAFNIISGDDSFLGPGTINYTSTTGVIAGTGTSFLTAWGTRFMAGSISSSGTTVTGNGTNFLSEARIGDLIGTAAKGFYKISAITSDVSLTLQVAPGTAFSGEASNCVENPTIQMGALAVSQIISITSDVAATTVTGLGNQTGVGYSIGKFYATGNTHVMIYVLKGSSGIRYCASTQRVTPFGTGFGGSTGFVGYNDYFRRIGSLLLNVGNIIEFSQYGMGHERWVYYEIPPNTLNMRILNGGGSAAWASVFAGNCVPPTAAMLMVNALVTNNSGGYLSLRKRSTSGGTAARSNRLVNPSTAPMSAPLYVAIDWSGYIDYAMGGGATGTLDVIGYMESL